MDTALSPGVSFGRCHALFLASVNMWKVPGVLFSAKLTVYWMNLAVTANTGVTLLCCLEVCQPPNNVIVRNCCVLQVGKKRYPFKPLWLFTLHWTLAQILHCRNDKTIIFLIKRCNKLSKCHLRETVYAQRVTANFSRMATGTKKMQLWLGSWRGPVPLTAREWMDSCRAA